MSESEKQLRALLSKTAKAEVSNLGVDDDVVEALGLDSLGALRLLAAVEKRFGVRFPDEHLSEFRTLRKILEVIPPARGDKP